MQSLVLGSDSLDFPLTAKALSTISRSLRKTQTTIYSKNSSLCWETAFKTHSCSWIWSRIMIRPSARSRNVWTT